VTVESASTPAWLATGLLAEPYRFDLIAALAVTGPQVRLRPALELAYPRAEVLTAEHDATHGWTLTVGLPGLYGPASPLPSSYTEDVLADEEDTLRRDLLDLVHQRLLLLLAASRQRTLGGPDQRRQLSLIAGLTERLVGGRIPGSQLLAFCGLLCGRSRSADALSRLLTSWSQVPCTIEQCIERWTPIPSAEQTRLGQANAALGLNTVAGDALCSRATSFRVAIGPLPWNQVEPWLPGGHGLADICALTDLLNSDSHDYEVVLAVETHGMPCHGLGTGRLGLDLRTTGEASGIRFDAVYRSPG
jgi:type VI secretion system protein ImpH